MEKENKNMPQEPAENLTNVKKNVNNKPNMVEEDKKTTKKPLKISKDAQENKNIAWLAYILFFIPLLINNKSAFVRHHANEGLEINIFDGLAVILLLIGGLVKTSVAWVQLLMIIFSIIGLILLVLTTVTKVYMIVSTLAGKEVSTPWMWNVKIIK